MTERDMLRIAMEQSAEDMGCAAEDFLAEENVLVPYRMGEGARRYLKAPITCSMATYGSNVVAAVAEDLSDLVAEYLGRYTFYQCFEVPAIHWLNECLARRGYKICRMAEYWLPGKDRIPELKCAYETRVLGQEDFAELYLPEWGNALCADRRQLDVLGVGAYDGDRLVGLAGCSADCEDMWQIGVDVLPPWRRRGIASALTAKLAGEILDRGKVPFYSLAWSNIRSARNAVRSGFIPAWAEMSVRPEEYVQY